MFGSYVVRFSQRKKENEKRKSNCSILKIAKILSSKKKKSFLFLRPNEHNRTFSFVFRMEMRVC